MNLLRRFCNEESGSTLIETAFVAPILVAITLGGVEAGSMFARQTQLQSIASNGMEIILTAAPRTEQEGAETLAQVKSYLAAESGLEIASGTAPELGQIAVYRRYRCGNNSQRQAENGCANESQKLSTFVVIYMRDSYDPVWANYGIGQSFTYAVKRTVQIG